MIGQASLRSHGQTNQLHSINWGALNHASAAPQLKSCNCCACAHVRACEVHTWVHVKCLKHPFTVHQTVWPNSSFKSPTVFIVLTLQLTVIIVTPSMMCTGMQTSHMHGMYSFLTYATRLTIQSRQGHRQQIQSGPAISVYMDGRKYSRPSLI